MKKVSQFTVVLIALFSAALVAVQVQGQEKYQEGVHYTRLAQPVGTAKPNKIEVAEIFSYACPACYRFEPLVESWKKQQPDDVNFVLLHMQWDKMTEQLARAMQAAKALRVMDKMQPALFAAIHENGKQLRNKASIKEVFLTEGVSEENFEKAWTSFGVDGQVKQSDTKIKALGINSTPQLAVNGEYVISISQSVDAQTALDVASFLVNKIRAERADN